MNNTPAIDNPDLGSSASDQPSSLDPDAPGVMPASDLGETASGETDMASQPQAKGIRNTLLWLAAFIALVLGMLLASVLMPRALTPEEARQIGWYQFEIPRDIPEFSMSNHLGEPVGPDSLKGDWSLLFFGFTTCPDICPTTLSVLAESMDGIDKPPRIVMVSVDPERDTVSMLANYVPAFDPDFIGYRGSFDETVKLATAVNIAFGKVPGAEPGSYLVDHSASLVVVNPEGRYAGFIKAPHQAQNLQRIYASLD